jgi:hypothetical protein
MTHSSSAVASKHALAAGYACRQYAESLSEIGAVHALPECGGWLLAEQIRDSQLADGVGCYPLYCCRDWGGLRRDVERLTDDLVSVRLVTDPFAEVHADELRAAFPDVCFEYKQHFVTDLSTPLDELVDGHHRRNVRKALCSVEVHESTGDADVLTNWQALYDNLTSRHQIQGVARFSHESFAKQLKVPGCVTFSATADGETYGMMIWYVYRQVAYYHLGAYSARGYEKSASYGLFWHALSHFAEHGIRWAALGGGAGTQAAESGLTRFKRGWSTHTRPVYFCGRILQPAAYADLAKNASPQSGYFPAYRAA